MSKRIQNRLLQELLDYMTLTKKDAGRRLSELLLHLAHVTVGFDLCRESAQSLVHRLRDILELQDMCGVYRFDDDLSKIVRACG